VSGGISTTWAVVVVLVLPLVIIVASEIDERLRQRESPLRGAVLVLRNWGLPFFAVWALLSPVLGVEDDSIAVRLAASGLLLAVAAASMQVLRVVIGGIRQRAVRGERRSAPELLLALPRLAVYIAAGWLLVAGVWGVDLSAALTALGVTSLVISFALQDTLSGLASGVLLLADQPFKPGDWIQFGEDSEGVVVDVNWRTSRVRDRNGDMTIIPNSQLASSPIINFSAPDHLHRVVVPVQVAYKNPPTLAKAMLLDAAKSTPGVRAEPPPAARVVQIDDPLMGYEVDMWIDDYRDQPRVTSDFGSLVWYQSNRHGVPLPSPAQDLYLYDGVAAEAEDLPTPDELRQALLKSDLLGTLTDDELDRLAHRAVRHRFAVGEAMFDSAVGGRGPIVIADGRALIVVVVDDRDGTAEEATVSELSSGDVVGLLEGDATGADHHIIVRAVSDCVVVEMDRDVFGEVGSRNSELADAVNRDNTVRRRRVERVIESRVVFDAVEELES